MTMETTEKHHGKSRDQEMGRPHLSEYQVCREDGRGEGLWVSIVSALSECLVWGVLLGIALAVGCSSSTESQYKDGRVYFINNARPPEPGDVNYVFNMRVVYEEQERFIPSNIDHHGDPTGAGSIDLTEGRPPLPGGTGRIWIATTMPIMHPRSPRLLTSS